MAPVVRRSADRAVLFSARHQSLRRSDPMGGAIQPVVHHVFVSQLHQVSAVALLPADDAGTGVAAAGLVRSGNAEGAEAAPGIRSRPAVLLPDSPAVDPRA